MPAESNFWKNSSARRSLLLHALLSRKLQRARHSPDDWVEACFRDPQGNPLRQAALHRQLQAFLTEHPRALVELPRDHGKSVQVCARILWELGRAPGLRVKVVCATEAVAAQRGRFLRESIEHNPLLRLVFPHLRPASPWTDTAFTVARPAEAIGPSVAALGLGSHSTGTRADLLVCDDLVDVRAMHSRRERERGAEHFRDNLLNLLDPRGRFWGLFTPWHREDLNAQLKQNPGYRLFRRAVDESLTPVWPERWPRERLRERLEEIGAHAFARGYRLLPLAEEEAVIRREWVRFWQPPQPCARQILAVDPAVSAGARADASGLVVLGQTPGGGVICLHAEALREPTPRLLHAIARLDQAWRPEVILFEANAAFRGIADLMIQHSSFGPRVRTHTQSRDKASRAHAFSVGVENGTFRLRGTPAGVDPSQRELFDEMTLFPHAEHDDLLDACMSGTAYLHERRDPRVWG